ncbi:MAG: BTAD domain-containing putative transcriptional regulator [Anaerolineae bacterium]
MRTWYPRGMTGKFSICRKPNRRFRIEFGEIVGAGSSVIPRSASDEGISSLSGQPLTEFYSSKVRALLAYLAVEAGREHPRPLLAALLWPDWDNSAALGNLRFSLSKLRQAINDQDADPPFLLISRDTIQLNPAAEVSVDVHLFQQELRVSHWESADRDGQQESIVRSAVEHLRTAMDLYRGPFLEAFSVGDSPAFEEWALVQREQLAREACEALHGLTALHACLGDYAAAERAVRRLLDMEPWDELGNRQLMVVLVQQGQRNAALRHYTAYRDEMVRELGCEPVAETQAPRSATAGCHSPGPGGSPSLRRAQGRRLRQAQGRRLRPLLPVLLPGSLPGSKSWPSWAASSIEPYLARAG